MDRPLCPDHPVGSVISARVPGNTRRDWVCLVCGKKLGDAGPQVDYAGDIPERMVIRPRDVGTLK